MISLIRSRSRTFHINNKVRQNFVHDYMPASVIYLTGLHTFVCSPQFIIYTKIQVIENCFFPFFFCTFCFCFNYHSVTFESSYFCISTTLFFSIQLVNVFWFTFYFFSLVKYCGQHHAHRKNACEEINGWQ